jgi:hypothetical protein
MHLRLFAAFILGIALTATAQDNSAPQGQRGQRNGMGGGNAGFGNFMGRGVTGAVTEIAADHFVVKTQTGETYIIHYSANTRFMKQMASSRPEGGAQSNGQAVRGQRNQNGNPGGNQGDASGDRQGRMNMGGNPPQQIKATDIKVGDAIAAMGEVDPAAKSVGAVGILQLDPERVRQMEQMQANYGKTWLMGKVTGVNDLQVTLLGSVDNAPHTFVADENTSFRERNTPITLADIHVNDVLRVEGVVKDGTFTAATVNVMRPPANATRVPGNPPPQ